MRESTMNRIELRFEQATNQSTEKRPFGLVIIYDHESVQREARRLIERLLRNCMPTLDVHCDALSFSEVMHSELQAETIELARECDLLVLATMNRAEATPAVAQWLDLWLATRTAKETGLVSLAGKAEDEPAGGSSLHEHLSWVAESEGLPYFSSNLVFSATGETPDPGRLEERGSSGQLRFEYFPRPEAWGINE
jgi:hypothetical protein